MREPSRPSSTAFRRCQPSCCLPITARRSQARTAPVHWVCPQNWEKESSTAVWSHYCFRMTCYTTIDSQNILLPQWWRNTDTIPIRKKSSSGDSKAGRELVHHSSAWNYHQLYRAKSSQKEKNKQYINTYIWNLENGTHELSWGKEWRHRSRERMDLWTQWEREWVGWMEKVQPTHIHYHM